MDTKELEYEVNAINESLNQLLHQVKVEPDKKRIAIYLNWIRKKTSLFEKEKEGFNVIPSDLPKMINNATYNYLISTKETIIDKYYTQKNMDYVLTNNMIAPNDCQYLYCKLVFVKRNIIWIDFGCNIGCEFGGKHPAVILKNLGNVLLVCPISSNNGKIRPIQTTIEFDINDVYNMPSQRKRFTDITRITPVSILRVDTKSQAGSIKNSKYQEILKKINAFYK